MRCADASPGPDTTAALTPATTPFLKKSRRLKDLSFCSLVSFRPSLRFLAMIRIPHFAPSSAEAPEEAERTTELTICDMPTQRGHSRGFWWDDLLQCS